MELSWQYRHCLTFYCWVVNRKEASVGLVNQEIWLSWRTNNSPWLPSWGWDEPKGPRPATTLNKCAITANSRWVNYLEFVVKLVKTEYQISQASFISKLSENALHTLLLFSGYMASCHVLMFAITVTMGDNVTWSSRPELALADAAVWNLCSLFLVGQVLQALRLHLLASNWIQPQS